MKDNNVYLSYYQAMVFMLRIDEMKKQDNDFDNEIAMWYEKYVLERTQEIVLFYPQFLLKLIPNATKFALSKYNFDYLCNLTNVNPLDRETLKTYKPLIKQAEENARNIFYNEHSRKI